MTPARPLPPHPDIEQLRRLAKELLRTARAGDPAALGRFRALPSLARAVEDELARARLGLHDAQSVVAREHGFASWNALRERVEELTLEVGAAVNEFVAAATDGRTDRAERLLALRPRLAGADFHAALLLGDFAAVERHLARNPAVALEPGGPRGWEPLLYVCHDSLLRGPVASADGLVSIARLLLDLGADPDTRFPWLHHGVRRPALWGAVCVTRLLPLAELLLRSGADPNDGVTLPLAASGGDVAALDLLRSFGADPNQPWASDGAPALYSILSWAPSPVGARWLLENGADPDPVFSGNGETPLHAVAKRGDVALAELLVSRGAHVSRERADGRTPYAVAELHGNHPVADWLRERGGSSELRPADRLVAACSRGDREAVEELLAARPALRGEIGAEHYVALHRAAEAGDLPALELLLACGFDPDRGDEEIGKTALHSAAMAGRPDAVRVLLAHGASPATRDREFHGQPLVWAAEGSRWHEGRGSDYSEVARLLLDAGSPLGWEPGEEPAAVILEILAGWRRDPSARTSGAPDRRPGGNHA
ncbi:MAG TPA: ankyrin repeat domain-containing protein [Longimicrobiaceae bacterium]|nr:ankyrin repeat domain-containing protein [Longimicrobiaceae bacterium]